MYQLLEALLRGGCKLKELRIANNRLRREDIETISALAATKPHTLPVEAYDTIRKALHGRLCTPMERGVRCYVPNCAGGGLCPAFRV